MKILKVYINKNGRKTAYVQKDDGTKTIRSFPRFLLEEKLGRPLLPEETVDHIDGDFTNDSFDNLRVLSRAENAAWAWKTGNCKPVPMSEKNKQMHKERMKGTKNPLSKFSEQQVVEIRNRKRYYGCINDWIKEFNVSRKTLYNLLNNISY